MTINAPAKYVQLLKTFKEEDQLLTGNCTCFLPNLPLKDFLLYFMEQMYFENIEGNFITRI